MNVSNFLSCFQVWLKFHGNNHFTERWKRINCEDYKKIFFSLFWEKNFFVFERDKNFPYFPNVRNRCVIRFLMKLFQNLVLFPQENTFQKELWNNFKIFRILLWSKVCEEKQILQNIPTNKRLIKKLFTSIGNWKRN